MIRYTLTRLALLLLGLFVASVLIFLTLRVLPGDVAQLIAGVNSTPEQVEAIRQRLGLDQSLPVQYLDWIGGIFRGDLGTSLLTGSSVADELAQKARVTVPLGIMALDDRGALQRPARRPLGDAAPPGRRARRSTSERRRSPRCRWSGRA